MTIRHLRATHSVKSADYKERLAKIEAKRQRSEYIPPTEQSELDKLYQELEALQAMIDEMEGEDTDEQRFLSNHPAVLRNDPSYISRRKSTTAFHSYDGDRYSILSGIRSIVGNKPLPDNIAEATDRICATTGKSQRSNSFSVPFNANLETRANTDTMTGAGLVTTNYDQDFLYLLRKQSIIEPLGIKVYQAPPGKFRLPVETSNAQASWVGEGDDMGYTNVAANYAEVTPLQLSCCVSVSRTLLNSSSYEADQIVRNDIIAATAEALNNAIVNGTGVAPQPMGILGNANVSYLPVSGFNYGWTDALNAERAVLEANAPSGSVVKHLTSPAGASKLKNQARIGTTFPSFVVENNVMNGNPVVSSPFVPKNLSFSGTNNLTALISGCFDEAFQLVLWNDGVDILIDPYTLGSTSNVRVFVWLFANILWRRPSLAKVQLFSYA